MSKAVRYALNEWEALITYLKDGRIEIDNNLTENAIRPSAVGKKNWLFIGSGVVEAGCKTIIGSRCKQSGMFWSEPGAENILALRCIRGSRQWQNFWKNRANELAARNDPLDLAA